MQSICGINDWSCNLCFGQWNCEDRKNWRYYLTPPILDIKIVTHLSLNAHNQINLIKPNSRHHDVFDAISYSLKPCCEDRSSVKNSKECNNKMGDKPKIVIIGSSKDFYHGMIKKICSTFKAAGAEIIYDPLSTHDDGKSMYVYQRECIQAIKDCDFVVAVPKQFFYKPNASKSMEFEFGDSTAYEISIAKEFKKPVMIWKG